MSSISFNTILYYIYLQFKIDIYCERWYSIYSLLYHADWEHCRQQGCAAGGWPSFSGRRWCVCLLLWHFMCSELPLHWNWRRKATTATRTSDGCLNLVFTSYSWCLRPTACRSVPYIFIIQNIADTICPPSNLQHAERQYLPGITVLILSYI